MRDPKRAAFALVIALACLFALVWMQGCASNQYVWRQAHQLPPGKLEWKTVDYSVVYDKCKDNPLQINEVFLACAVPQWDGDCTVYSTLYEVQAHWKRDKNGDSVYEHELKHCEGWRHQ